MGQGFGTGKGQAEACTTNARPDVDKVHDGVHEKVEEIIGQSVGSSDVLIYFNVSDELAFGASRRRRHRLNVQREGGSAVVPG